MKIRITGEKCLFSLLFLLGFFPFFGCSLVTGPGADDILAGIGRVPDTVLVKEGMPTYIIMVEGMLARNPEDPQLLKAAAQLYSLYGSNYVEDEIRAGILTDKALDYAFASASAFLPGFDQARNGGFEEFEKLLKKCGQDAVDFLFLVGSVWLDWVKARGDDLDSIADIPMIQLLLERVVQLDRDYMDGMPLLYLALIAAMENGDQRQVENYFEGAIEASEGKNIMADVLYGLWLKNNGRKEQGCKMLKMVIENGSPQQTSTALLNEFALKKARQAVTDQNSLCEY